MRLHVYIHPGSKGCGKTYTMLGTLKSPGIMVLTLEDLFKEIKKQTQNQYKVTLCLFVYFSSLLFVFETPTNFLLLHTR